MKDTYKNILLAFLIIIIVLCFKPFSLRPLHSRNNLRQKLRPLRLYNIVLVQSHFSLILTQFTGLYGTSKLGKKNYPTLQIALFTPF